jgi:hypothetical protein
MKNQTKIMSATEPKNKERADEVTLSESSAESSEFVKQTHKRNSFDREVRALFVQAEQTIKSKYGTSIELGDIRPELHFLNRYAAVYKNKDAVPEDHYPYFELMYNRNRVKILNSFVDDSWLREGNVIIQYGEGIKGIENRAGQVKILLSVIYRIACDLQKDAEKRIEGLGENADGELIQAAGGKDLIRPNILMLHLVRIFYYLNDGPDKSRLADLVTKLETELNVPKKTIEGEALALQEAGSQPTMAGGLSGLFTLATNMMKNMGMTPPPGMTTPTEKQIMDVIDNVFNNETTQKAMSGMFESIKDCDDFGSALQTVVKNVTDPQTMADISGTVAHTAQSLGLDAGNGLDFNNTQ